jgi:hypothetical protein
MVRKRKIIVYIPSIGLIARVRKAITAWVRLAAQNRSEKQIPHTARKMRERVRDDNAFTVGGRAIDLRGVAILPRSLHYAVRRQKTGARKSRAAPVGMTNLF